MDLRRFPLPLLLVAALTAPVTAWAGAPSKDGKDEVDVCDEQSVVDEGSNEEFAAPVVAEVVVPCAMAENGTLGPACQDAAFYVVNQRGTLLCRVELATFTNAAPTPMLEQSPASPSSSPGFATVAAVVPTVQVLAPPAQVTFLPSPGSVELLRAADAHVHDRPRPS